MCNTRELCENSGRADQTNHSRLSVSFLSQSISVHILRHVVRQLRHFLSLLLTASKTKTVSVSAKRPIGHEKAGLGATTLQPEYALDTVSQVETKFDSYNALPLHILKLLSVPWETGSPRPSDNLFFHRTMTECFPITGGLFLFPSSY